MNMFKRCSYQLLDIRQHITLTIYRSSL